MLVPKQESLKVVPKFKVPPPSTDPVHASTTGSAPSPSIKLAERGKQIPPAIASPFNVITVVRDPEHHLGKTFTLNPDGTVGKESSVSVSLGIAVMHQVDTHDELAALQKKVGDDSHAAIINASFPGISIGEQFIILSEREMEKRLGIPRTDRAKQKGIHQLEYNGKSYPAVGRFKENVRASSWQILDRDIDAHTPEKFSAMSFDEFMLAFYTMLPGVANVSYVKTASTSSRVLLNGVAVGGGNGHAWVKVEDPDDVERFRTAIQVRAAELGMTWKKPRYSRSEPGKVVGHSLTTLIDTSVWTPGRLVFIGKPVVGDGLTVEPLSATIHKGESDVLDTSTVILPDAPKIREITRNAGVEMSVTSSGNGLRITTRELTLDTEIETDSHGVLSIREILERGIKDKIRCQTPFRASTSMAAFFSLGADGRPFIYDVGTGITHWLNDAESKGQGYTSAEDSFDVCETEVIHPTATPYSVPVVVESSFKIDPSKQVATINPLEKYSLRGMSDELEKSVVDAVPILGGLALLGQATGFFAAPNTGKTALTLSLTVEDIKAGRVDPTKVFYLNMDDSGKGLLEKVRIAEEFNFHMLAEGHRDFSASAFLSIMRDMIENDQAHGVVVILDTLKKFVDLMDKSRTSAFTNIVRPFVMKGGTVIALAHTNKNPGKDGKPVYGGVSDILNDIDCAYTIAPVSAEDSVKVVEFVNIKSRGSVTQTAAYSYCIGNGIPYNEIILSVQSVDQTALEPLKQAAEIESDAEVIAAVTACIKEGVNTKMNLASATAKRASISRRSALQFVDKYTGDDPALHRWTFSKGARGAMLYTLLIAPQTDADQGLPVEAIPDSSGAAS